MTDHTTPNTRAQYWKEQINAWRASRQSQQAFCKTHQLNYPRFGYWLRKFREQDSIAVAPRRSPGFVPVVAAPARSDLTVRLPNGIELHGITADNLLIAEQLLARL